MMSGEIPTWYDPDFIQRNGTFILSVLGLFGACCGGLSAYLLKSRCRNIKCCGMECERDVIPVRPRRASSIEMTPANDL